MSKKLANHLKIVLLQLVTKNCCVSSHLDAVGSSGILKAKQKLKYFSSVAVVKIGKKKSAGNHLLSK